MGQTDMPIIAAVQMISVPDVAQNLAQARTLIGEAVRQGARLVALPEYFAIMSGDERAKVAVRETDGDGPIQSFLADTAREFGIWLVGGTVPLTADDADKVRNASLVFGPDGTRAARYDKVHLFGFDNGDERYAESETIEPGHDVVTVETDLGRLGLSICYDLRFPELFRAMGEVDLIVLPAAFTYTTGKAHWEIMLRTRAIENQCHVLAPAQGGRHPWGRRTYGDSLIIDPWGEVLNRLAQGPGVVSAPMDHERTTDIRTRLPALTHRRFV